MPRLLAWFMTLVATSCVLVTADDLSSKVEEIGSPGPTTTTATTGATGTPRTTTDTFDPGCTWYLDSDDDGWGVEDLPFQAPCDPPPGGYAGRAGDCDDGDPLIHPEAEERCNGLDDDCDDAVDEGVPTEKWYEDKDRDGYGAPETAIQACEDPGEARVRDDTDCDDEDPDVHPGQAEWFTEPRGNGSYDYNCDGEEDLQYPSTGACRQAVGVGCADPVEGWQITTPNCGNESDWIVDCFLDGLVCTATTEVRTQGCH